MKKKTSLCWIFICFIIVQVISGCTESVPPQEETFAPQSDPSASDLVVHFLDVGQGDCIYITLPNGDSMLIDAGEQVYANGVINFIKEQGTQTLTYVVATLPQAHHIGGLADIIASFDVKNVYMPQTSDTTDTAAALRNAMNKKGLTPKTARGGEVLFDNGILKAEFLAPNAAAYSRLNNYSAVLKLTYNNKAFLFMSDAEAQSEEAMLSEGYRLTADVLKVGNHGSNTSTTGPFVKAVHPTLAIISVGKNNGLGHPSDATLEILKNNTISIWRTDEKGTIVVTCDGNKISSVTGSTSIQAYAPLELAEEKSAAVPETPKEKSGGTQTAATRVEDQQNITVYITNSGSKYHRDGCRFLSQSQIPVSLDSLDTGKYTPCSVCKPPQK